MARSACSCSSASAGWRRDARFPLSVRRTGFPGAIIFLLPATNDIARLSEDKIISRSGYVLSSKTGPALSCPAEDTRQLFTLTPRMKCKQGRMTCHALPQFYTYRLLPTDCGLNTHSGRRCAASRPSAVIQPTQPVPRTVSTFWPMPVFWFVLHLIHGFSADRLPAAASLTNMSRMILFVAKNFWRSDR